MEELIKSESITLSNLHLQTIGLKDPFTIIKAFLTPKQPKTKLLIASFKEYHPGNQLELSSEEGTALNSEHTTNLSLAEILHQATNKFLHNLKQAHAFQEHTMQQARSMVIDKALHKHLAENHPGKEMPPVGSLLFHPAYVDYFASSTRTRIPIRPDIRNLLDRLPSKKYLFFDSLKKDVISNETKETFSAEMPLSGLYVLIVTPKETHKITTNANSLFGTPIMPIDLLTPSAKAVFWNYKFALFEEGSVFHDGNIPFPTDLPPDSKAAPYGGMPFYTPKKTLPAHGIDPVMRFENELEIHTYLQSTGVTLRETAAPSPTAGAGAGAGLTPPEATPMAAPSPPHASLADNYIAPSDSTPKPGGEK